MQVKQILKEIAELKDLLATIKQVTILLKGDEPSQRHNLENLAKIQEDYQSRLAVLVNAIESIEVEVKQSTTFTPLSTEGTQTPKVQTTETEVGDDVILGPVWEHTGSTIIVPANSPSGVSTGTNTDISIADGSVSTGTNTDISVTPGAVSKDTSPTVVHSEVSSSTH